MTIKRFDNDGLVRTFAAKATQALVLRGAWAVLNYLSLLFLARWLSPEHYGTFAVIISVVTFLGIVMNLGTQSTVMRFLGKYQAEDQPGFAKGIISLSRKSVFWGTVTTTVLAICVLEFADQVGWIKNTTPYMIGILLLPAFSLVDTQSGIARSFGSVLMALAPRDVFWRGGLIAIAWLATLPLVPVSAQLNLTLALSVVLLSLLVGWQFLATERLIPLEVKTADAKMRVKEWRKVAFPIWLAAVANVSMRTLDVMILALVLPPKEVGYYFAATRTSMLTGFVLQSINLVTAPQISQSYHANNTMKLRRLTALSTLLAFPSALIMCVLFLFAGSSILNIFGPEFASAWPSLCILSLGYLVASFVGPSGLLLDMTKHEALNTKILLLCSGLASCLLYPVALIFGQIGAATVVALALALAAILRWIAVRRHLSLDPSILSTPKYLRADR